MLNAAAKLSCFNMRVIIYTLYWFLKMGHKGPIALSVMKNFIVRYNCQVLTTVLS